jgi:hypothetical protein
MPPTNDVVGKKSNKTTEIARILGSLLNPVREERIIKVKPRKNIMYLISNSGIKTKTVRKVPIILPIVDTE